MENTNTVAAQSPVAEAVSRFPGLRNLWKAAALIAFMNVLVVASIEQWRGELLTVSTFSLYWWEGNLPFEIARAWDGLLLPLFLFASYKIFQWMERQDLSSPLWMRGDFSTHAGYLDLLLWSMSAAYVAGILFGIVYAVPVFLVIPLLLATHLLVTGLVFMLGSGLIYGCYLISRLFSR